MLHICNSLDECRRKIKSIITEYGYNHIEVSFDDQVFKIKACHQDSCITFDLYENHEYVVVNEKYILSENDIQEYFEDTW